MSVSMSMRLEKHTRRSPRFNNFEDLYREKKTLDKAAKAAGVPSLFSFTHRWGRRTNGRTPPWATRTRTT